MENYNDIEFTSPKYLHEILSLVLKEYPLYSQEGKKDKIFPVTIKML